ncbi:MAG: VanW family protein [Polyangiaceae bacterium]
MPRFQAPSARRILCAAAVLGTFATGGLLASRALLPSEGALAQGLRVGGEPVLADQSGEAVAKDRAARALARKVTFTWNGAEALTATLADLGAEVDEATLARRAAEVGHDGDLVTRLVDALAARDGSVDLRVPVTIGADALANKLTRFKEENDTNPVDARLKLEDHTATEDAPGKYADVYAALSALDSALAKQPSGDLKVELPSFSIAPRATKSVVLAIDVSKEVSRFETKFGYLGGQANRGGNVARAASQIDGVVLMPGEIVSFNEHVGPRSVDNGFFPAPEIYKGEMREGIGGGTCQVAGTLHAAAYFGGLDIVERSPHSRPSGYIRMGLDATVVYPTTDLKLRNPYDFPVVVHAVIDKGTLRFELRGKVKAAEVDLTTETVSNTKYKRKIEEISWFPEGKVVLKQKGITGHTIKKTRVMKLWNGTTKTEVTTDVYPATFEIYQIGPGTDPDSLPPPPEEGDAPAAPATPPVQVAAASPTSG